MSTSRLVKYTQICSGFALVSVLIACGHARPAPVALPSSSPETSSSQAAVPISSNAIQDALDCGPGAGVEVVTATYSGPPDAVGPNRPLPTSREGLSEVLGGLNFNFDFSLFNLVYQGPDPKIAGKRCGAVHA